MSTNKISFFRIDDLDFILFHFSVLWFAEIDAKSAADYLANSSRTETIFLDLKSQQIIVRREKLS
jgi:hypothetical protein